MNPVFQSGDALRLTPANSEDLANSGFEDCHTSAANREVTRRSILRQLMDDEAGLVITVELVMIITIVVLALSVGWEAVATLLVEELEDVANAVGQLDQSYGYASLSAGNHGFTNGSAFSDSANSVNISATFPDFSGLIPDIDTGNVFNGASIVPAIANRPEPRNRIQFEGLDDPVFEELERNIGTTAMSEIIGGIGFDALEIIVTDDAITAALLTSIIQDRGIDGFIALIRELGPEGFVNQLRAELGQPAREFDSINPNSEEGTDNPLEGDRSPTPRRASANSGNGGSSTGTKPSEREMLMEQLMKLQHARSRFDDQERRLKELIENSR